MTKPGTFTRFSYKSFMYIVISSLLSFLAICVSVCFSASLSVYMFVCIIIIGYRPHSKEKKVSYASLHPDEYIDIHIDYILREKNLSGHKLWDILYIFLLLFPMIWIYKNLCLCLRMYVYMWTILWKKSKWTQVMGHPVHIYILPFCPIIWYHMYIYI